MAFSDVVICNLALGHIGTDALLASIDPPDGSVESGHCARYYPLARQELVASYPWTFMKTRVALSQVANPSNVWTYAYQVPSDCINPLRTLTTSTLDVYGFFPYGGLLRADEAALFTERGSADFEIENGVLLTHEQDAVLLYTRDVIDTSRYSPGFVVALSYLLASYLAGPLIKGSEGASAALRLRDAASRKMKEAQMADANGVGETNEFVPAHIRRRA